MILGDDFFNRDTVAVARELIGTYLVRKSEAGAISSMITETEAYDGPEDLACHGAKGRTSRTEVMFGPAGHWYVYFVYGMHNMLNIVTGPIWYPAAVLIRATAAVAGPGRLTKHFSVDRSLNAKAAVVSSGLWIEDRGAMISEAKISATPRIGIDYAGPIWSQKPWRFLLSN